MFLLHGDAKYLDVLERILYNGFLSGVSLDGERFFYPNPLASTGTRTFNMGKKGRSEWFDCSCCPTNVVRFLPSIPGYAYAQRDRDVAAGALDRETQEQRALGRGKEELYPEIRRWYARDRGESTLREVLGLFLREA